MRLSILIIALYWFAKSSAQTNINPSSGFQQMISPESTPQWMTFEKDARIASN